jgi:inactivated superfamily I helicase
VSGWVVAANVRLVLGGSVAEMAPQLLRADVAREKNIAPEVGFVLHLPCTADILAHAEAPGLVFFPMPGRPDIPSLSIPLSET